MYFGVKAIIAKSFARIHRANLMNYAVLPLTLVDEDDHGRLDPEDRLEIPDVRQRLLDGAEHIPVHNRTQRHIIDTCLPLTDRERQVVLAGGLLRFAGKEFTT